MKRANVAMLKPEQKNLLEHTHLSHYFDNAELELLISHNEIITYISDETIIKQDTIAQGIYLILEGSVTLSAKLLSQGVTKLETLTAGQFIGEVSFIEQIPSATSAVSNSNVTCLFISHIFLELLSHYRPATKYKLLTAITQQICERLKKMHQKVIEIIENSKIVPRSLFSEMMQSLTKYTEIDLNLMEAELKQLAVSPNFKSFTINEFYQLLDHAVILNAPKNCTLIRRDEKNISCFITLHGAVQTSIVQANKAAKLSVIGPGILFAGVACIAEEMNFTVTFTTCEQAILLKISDENLSKIKADNPTLWYKIYELICKSLAALAKSVDKLDVRLNIEVYNR